MSVSIHEGVELMVSESLERTLEVSLKMKPLSMFLWQKSLKRGERVPRDEIPEV